MKLILITGSSGMVGRALVKILKNKYNLLTPSSKLLDLKKEEKVINYLKQKKPTHPPKERWIGFLTYRSRKLRGNHF